VLIASFFTGSSWLCIFSGVGESEFGLGMHLHSCFVLCTLRKVADLLGKLDLTENCDSVKGK